MKHAIALGFFDGVHLGHGALLRAVAEDAQRDGHLPVALTFDTHPDRSVRGALLTTPEERRELMQRFYGIENVCVLPFDDALRNTPWETFALDTLLGKLNAAALVCGEDFRFGRGAEGTAKLLADFCAAHGVACRVVPQVCLDGAPVSSTRIRKCLQEGSFEDALRLRGHPYLLLGEVVHGRHVGGRLGFPTANLTLKDRLPLPYGVYAATVELDGSSYTAVTNVGVHPTVGALSAPVAESWLQDFDGDLYGKEIALYLHAFLRPERRFADESALRAQIAEDKSSAAAYFAAHP